MPVYVRVTVNGTAKEFASRKQCDPVKWNTKLGLVNRSKQEDRSINASLNALEKESIKLILFW